MMRANAGSVVVVLIIGLVFGLGLRSLPDISAARATGAAVPAAANGAPAQAVPATYAQAPVVGQDTFSAAQEGQAPVLVSMISPRATNAATAAQRMVEQWRIIGSLEIPNTDY